MNYERNATKDILDSSNFKLSKQEFYLLFKKKKNIKLYTRGKSQKIYTIGCIW